MKYPLSLVVLLWIIAAVMCLYRLGDRSLVRWDEQTNRNVVTSTVRHPTFPELRIHDTLFFEKPPLWYWLTAAISDTFGTDALTLRLVSALSGITLLIVVWSYVKTYASHSAAFVAVLFLLATTQLFIRDAGGFFSTHTLRSADPDALFLLLFTASALLSVPAAEGKRTALLATGATGALAALTKGPLGLLPFAILLTWPEARRNLRMADTLKALLLCAAVVLPWHILMYRTFGNGFLRTYIGYHILARLTVPLEGHLHPWWYYLQILFSPATSPGIVWTAAAAASLRHNGNVLKKPLIRLPMLTVGVTALIIFVTRTTLAWYTLPLYPLLAVVTAIGIDRSRVRIWVLPAALIYLSVFTLLNALIIYRYG